MSPPVSAYSVGKMRTADSANGRSCTEHKDDDENERHEKRFSASPKQ
jgi:hypothetical protein